jgi:hypothetical protein
MSDIDDVIRVVLNPPVRPGGIWNNAVEAFHADVRLRRETLEPNTTFDDPYDIRWMGDEVSCKSLVDQMALVTCHTVVVTCAQFRKLRDEAVFGEIPATWVSGRRGHRGQFEWEEHRDSWLRGRLAIGNDRRVDISANLDDAERARLEKLGHLKPLAAT